MNKLCGGRHKTCARAWAGFCEQDKKGRGTAEYRGVAECRGIAECCGVAVCCGVACFNSGWTWVSGWTKLLVVHGIEHGATGGSCGAAAADGQPRSCFGTNHWRVYILRQAVSLLRKGLKSTLWGAILCCSCWSLRTDGKRIQTEAGGCCAEADGSFRTDGKRMETEAGGCCAEANGLSRKDGRGTQTEAGGCCVEATGSVRSDGKGTQTEAEGCCAEAAGHSEQMGRGCKQRQGTAVQRQLCCSEQMGRGCKQAVSSTQRQDGERATTGMEQPHTGQSTDEK
eukprot:733853-Pelagomonas_calceolata.AAC.5